MKKILLVLAVLLYNLSFAQNAGTSAPVQTSTVVVHKDPRLDALVKKKAAINKSTKKGMDRTMRGYRLLIINTNRREDAISAKTKIYTYYPELKSYLQYQTPYFKLKAGNFQTRAEAERYQKDMSKLFPKGVFIVNDIIEVKGEKDTEEEED